MRIGIFGILDILGIFVVEKLLVDVKDDIRQK
jgi:hypothetical protein